MAQLGQLSNLRGSARGAASLAQILVSSPFLRWFDQQSGWEEDATSFLYDPIEGSMTVAARALGGSYTAADMTPAARQTGTLKFHGFAVDIDQSHIADDLRGLQNLSGWIDKSLKKKVDSWAKAYEGALFNNDGSGNLLKGLKTIFDGTTNLPGFSITGVINAKDAVASGNSLDLTSDTNYDAFVEHLILWMTQVEDLRGMVMSPRMFARMYTIAKKTHQLGQTIDQFGQPVDTFNGVPLIRSLDTTILHNEPDDAGTPATNTTSIWLMSPGEMRQSLVTNSGLDFEDYDKLESKQSGRVKGEIRAAWKVEERNAVRRIRNIKV